MYLDNSFTINIPWGLVRCKKPSHRTPLHTHQKHRLPVQLWLRFNSLRKKTVVTLVTFSAVAMTVITWRTNFFYRTCMHWFMALTWQHRFTIVMLSTQYHCDPHHWMWIDAQTSSATPISMTAFWRGKPQHDEMQGAILEVGFVSQIFWHSEIPKCCIQQIHQCQLDFKLCIAQCATEMQVVTLVLVVDQ